MKLAIVGSHGPASMDLAFAVKGALLDMDVHIQDETMSEFRKKVAYATGDTDTGKGFAT